MTTWLEGNSKLLKLLCERFPATFFSRGTTPRPLKLGIHKDLIAALGDEAVSKKAIRTGMGWYTRRPGYLKALVEGGQRVDLAGNDVECVRTKHQEAARAMLARRKAPVAKPKSSTPAGEARIPKPGHP